MKLNVLLNNVDGLFDEDLMEQVENYFEQDYFLQLKEVEKNLWSCTFEIEDRCETEVRLSGQKVREVACDCAIGGRNELCWHAAVALIGVRDKVSSAKAEKIVERQAKIQSNKVTKLTVAQIVKQVPEEALRAFIIEQARSNKDLALALKMYFSSGLNQNDRLTPYKELIDTELSLKKVAQTRLTSKKVQHIAHTLQQFNKKAQAVAKEGDWPFFFDLARLVLPAYLRCLRYVSNTKLERHYRAFCLTFEEVYPTVAAPEIRLDFWTFVQAEWAENAHYAHTHELFSWLLHVATTQEQQAILEAAIDKKMQLYRANRPMYEGFLTHKIRLFWSQNNKKAIKELVASAYTNTRILYDNIHNYYNNGWVELVEIMAEAALPLFKADEDPALLLSVYQLLFIRYAEREEMTEKAIKLAKKLLVKQLDIKYYNYLKLKNIDPTEIDVLIETIGQLRFRTEQRDVLAEIFFTEGYFDTLCAYAVKLQSLELVRVYGPKLWSQTPEKALEMIRKVLADYLLVHLGTAPAQRIRVIIEYYMMSGAFELAYQVAAALRQQFPERQSLLKELDDLFA